MMVKFFDHGQGEAAPAMKYLIEEVVVDYDQYRQPKRDAAGRIKRVRRSISPEVLKGHPERMIDLVDAVPHRWRYKSGVLSFAAEDAPTEAQQRQMMEAFEAFACPGLTHDSYRMLWVRHLHAGRVELHFLMPRMELRTGKSLRQNWIAASEKTGGRPSRPSCGASQAISRSVQIIMEPRLRNAAL